MTFKLLFRLGLVSFIYFVTACETREEKKITIGVWDNYSEKSMSEWDQYFKKYIEAGITDYFIHGSPENIQKLAQIVHGRDINLHAWVWTMNRPGDRVAEQNRDWYSVNRNEDNSYDYRAYVDYYQWLSPFSEGAREHIKSIMKSYAEIAGITSVHLDYVRYCDVVLPPKLQPKYKLVQDREMAEYDFGYHPEARRGFKTIFGVDPLEMDHPELSDEWRQYRLNALTSLVNEIAEIVHAHDKKLSAAVFPFPEMARKMVRQDWSSWDLDIVCPMNYHNFYNDNLDWIKFSVENGVRETQGKFHYNSGLFVGALSPEDLKKAIQKSKDAGANGVTLFSVNGLTDTHLEILKTIKQ